MIKCHGSQLDAKFYGQERKRYPEAIASATLKPRLKPATVPPPRAVTAHKSFHPMTPALLSLESGRWRARICAKVLSVLSAPQ